MINLKKPYIYFTPNYIAFLATAAIFLFSLLLRYYKGYIKLFTVITIVLITVNLLPPMKRWVTFYGPEGSWGLRCRDLRENGANPNLNNPRYFDATGTSLLSANINIYPRMRFVQGYDAVVLRNFADEYRKYIHKGVRAGRRAITKQNEAPEEYLKKAGVGKVVLNPLPDTEGTWEKATDIDIFLKDVSFPECTITHGECEMFRIKPELIEITVNTNEIADLTIAETHYPTWRYRFDDERDSHKVQPSEHGFMKIPNIPPGTSKVTLFYDPHFERLSLILSSASFIIGLAIIIGLDKKERTAKKGHI
jgi:hypothetical protein